MATDLEYHYKPLHITKSSLSPTYAFTSSLAYYISCLYFSLHSMSHLNDSYAYHHHNPRNNRMVTAHTSLTASVKKTQRNKMYEQKTIFHLYFFFLENVIIIYLDFKSKSLIGRSKSENDSDWSNGTYLLP